MFGSHWLESAFSGTASGSRVSAERRVESDAHGGAPEHRVSGVLRAEFDEDGSSVQLVVRLPFGEEIRFLDSRQVEATLRLLGEALPQLRALEAEADPAWERWRAPAPGS